MCRAQAPDPHASGASGEPCKGMNNCFQGQSHGSRPQLMSPALQEISNSRKCGLFGMKSFAFSKLASQSHLHQTIQEPNTTHLWSTLAASSHSALWSLAGRREEICWTKALTEPGTLLLGVQPDSGSSLLPFCSSVTPQ